MGRSKLTRQLRSLEMALPHFPPSGRRTKRQGRAEKHSLAHSSLNFPKHEQAVTRTTQ